MAVAFVASAGTSASALSALQVTNPGFSTVASDRYIIAIVSAIGTLTTFVPPAGFAPIGSVQAATGSNTNIRVYGKWATSSEPANYSWSWSPSSYLRIVMLEYSGCGGNPTIPVSAFSTRGGTSSTSSILFPSVRVDVDDGAVILGNSLGDNRDYGTITNFTGREVLNPRRGHVYDRIDPPLTATGTITETITGGATTWATAALHLSPTTVPAPSYLTRPVISGTVGLGQTLTCSAGTVAYAYAQTYQWMRNGVAISGATNATYSLQAADSAGTITCRVTAVGAGGTTPSDALAVSFYLLGPSDIGHEITVDVGGVNSAGATSVESIGRDAQFQNTVLPTISGTAAAGATLTAIPGTYVETVSSRTYTWLIDGTYEAHVGSTFTPGEEYGSRQITVREDVTGAAGTGTATSVSNAIFSTMAIPWLTTASPWYTEIPEDEPIDSAWTSTLQGYITAQNTANSWWYNGGNHGQNFSAFINIVDSSMPRTAFDLVTSSGGTPVTATKNGTEQTHLAWCFKTKNGGVPTPPFGFKVAGGTDKHLLVYCRDTDEYWGAWVTQLTGYDNPRIQWGCYIPDVTQFIGYCQNLTTTPGTEGDPEKQFQSWGETAAFPIGVGLITRRDTYDEAAEDFGHMMSIQLTGNNHTARYPSLRTENSISAPLPLGGIWRIDPTFDPDSLTPLANPQSQSFRSRLIRTAQKYGLSNNDSTATTIAFRLESTAAASYSYPIADSMNTIMKSIPVTAWQMINASYRPAGGDPAPTLPALSTWRLNTGMFNPYGCTLDGSGRLTMNASFGGICYSIAGLGDFTDDEIYVRLRQAADQVQFQVRATSGNEADCAQFIVDTGAGTIKANIRYNGSTLGSDTSATYDTGDHAWLKIAHDEGAGTIIFSTAEDLLGVPINWAVFRTYTVPGTFWDIAACAPSFYAPVGGSGTAVFTNLNETPAPVATSPGWVVGVA